jgi:2-succinyl-6-hydroxy-2,4-cyclohexadiene-1-carboxylate synthase
MAVSAPEHFVLLHGFSGTRRAWDGVLAALDSSERYLHAHALDLPGHGAAAEAPRPITFAACVEHVLAHSPERFALCGYSLGGRVALHVALAAPERVSRLVLVSSSPGIEDPRERAARRAADRRLALELEREPFEEFIERWRSQALFAAEPPHARELARADQRRNQPEALAAVLRGLGAGEMRPLWRHLGALTMPTLLVVGARDQRYVELARGMLMLLAGGELAIVPGGHGLPLENPRALAALLADSSAAATAGS